MSCFVRVGKLPSRVRTQNLRTVEKRVSHIYTQSTLLSAQTQSHRSCRSYSDNARGKPSLKLTHIDEHGQPAMVDVGNKSITTREATASGRIVLTSAAFDLVVEDEPVQHSSSETRANGSSLSSDEDEALATAKQKARSKGNVLQTARLAAIMASKQTSALIPLCHPLPLTHVHVSFSLAPETRSVWCTATARCDGKTGVEMEALTAVSVGLLTVWDMLKAVAGKEMIVSSPICSSKKKKHRMTLSLRSQTLRS